MIVNTDQKRTFELFLDYWNTIVHRQCFGSVETFVRTSMIFSSLKFYWIAKFEGDLEKLKFITLAMDYLDEDLIQILIFTMKVYTLGNFLSGK